MNPAEQTRSKSRLTIDQKVSDLNPLLDEGFLDALSRDRLFYDDVDEHVPRDVENRRLIAELWSDGKMQTSAQIKRWSGRFEPSHHAILAEGVKVAARPGPIDFNLLWAAAKLLRKRLIERHIEEIGHEAFYIELRYHLLLAIEQLAEHGLTDKSLPAIKDIEWFSSLAHRHQKSFGY